MLSLAAIVVFLLLPAALLGRSQSLRRRPSFRWTLVIASSLVALLIAYPLPTTAWMVAQARSLPGLGWLLPMLGGAAWGWFLLLNLRIAFPAMTGLSNVRHGNVGPMLRAWCVASAMRLALLGAWYAPFALAFADASPALWMLVAPLFGLLLQFWLLSLVDHLAAFLDRKLVNGKASAENRWHPIVRKYFMGYVKRAGLQLDRSLLDRTLFLPGTREGIVAYGGGLASFRVLVHESLLETALHPAAGEPLFDDEDDRPIDAGDAFGVIVPEGGVGERSSPERRPAPISRPVKVRPLLGQNETLLGTIVPLPGESVPLVIDDPDEYSVLRELLTAHYSAFDPALYGEEADDTDPTQKDFLFGALLREVGCIQRQDTLFFTLTLTLDLLLSKAPAPVRAIQRALAIPYRRFFARHPAIVADGFAGLNRGLDHLIQYLFHSRTKDVELLTARADEPTLAATSAEILRRIEAEPEGVQDDLRNRIVWLSQQLHAPIAEPRRLALKAIAALILLLGFGGALALKVIESMEYQPIYEKRIRDQRQKIEEARQKGTSTDVR
jgi:hypothetical protein